ncbi:HTH_Tnp_Tc3_2 domain-containing protein [Trichonephila clavipes]|nr:HTH_Tnp_Tc3_2 domain-containing protein [Trichonephila clavipes]
MANNQSVRRHLDAFTRGRIIGKLEESRSVTSVAAKFGIAHSIVSRFWRQFQTIGTAIRGFSSGRPRGTTPADDRCIVLQARRNKRQTAGEIARHPTQATGRPISRFTVARRLHDESRFSLSSDSHRILIWRERGSRNHPSNIIERDRGSMGLQFLFMDDNAPCHRTVAAEKLLESEDIVRLAGTISGSQSHRACMGLSRQTLGSSYLTTSNDSGASIGAARRMGSNASTTH